MADICVPPDCLNGYDCYWLFFCLFTGINTKKLNTFSILDTIYCDILWYILLYSYYCYILLYLSLYLYYIWYRFSFLCKSILLFGEMAKLVLTVVYTVIYSYSCYIYCYISLYYLIYLIIETLFTPPSLLC